MGKLKPGEASSKPASATTSAAAAGKGKGKAAPAAAAKKPAAPRKRKERGVTFDEISAAPQEPVEEENPGEIALNCGQKAPRGAQVTGIDDSMSRKFHEENELIRSLVLKRHLAGSDVA